jgi:hypothetical protein
MSVKSNKSIVAEISAAWKRRKCHMSQSDPKIGSWKRDVPMLLLAVAGLVGSLRAADPMIGTWRLNIARSRLPPIQANTQENSFVVRELGDDFELVGTGTQKDGSPISVKCTWPQLGGFRKYEYGGPGEGISIVDILVDSGDGYTKGNGYSVILRNGRQIAVTQWILSEDGKTWRGI